MREKIITRIIAGFPGVGKTYLYDHQKEFNLVVLDSDSSEFSWVSEGVRNPDFPNNYIKHIIDHIGIADIILISTHKVVRDALRENNIMYDLVYPGERDKGLYLKKFIQRGSSNAFIEMMSEKWDSFLDELHAEVFPISHELLRGQTLTQFVCGLKPAGVV